MSLEPKKKQKLKDWLDKKTPEGEEGCPVCGHNEWGTSRVGIPAREGRELNVNKILPLIAIECKNCGNELLFNEEVIGL